jgi:hypothetical protein
MSRKPLAFINLAMLFLFLTSCNLGEGEIQPPNPPTTTPRPPDLSLACPVPNSLIRIPATGCDFVGVRLNNVTLTCGGDGKLPIRLSTPPGAETRYMVTLVDGSLLTTSATPFNSFCWDGITVQIGITLGLEYTGDVRTESTGPGAGKACISRSKVVITQFLTSDPLLSLPGIQQLLKNSLSADLLQKFDTQIMDSIYRTPGDPPLPVRCVQYKALP